MSAARRVRQWPVLAQCPILQLTADPDRRRLMTLEAAPESGAVWKVGRLVRIQDERFEPYGAAVRTCLEKLDQR